MSDAWTKADLINELARSRGCRFYLEVCTPTSGGLYSKVSRSELTCKRLMYRCPESFDDGWVIDYRSPDLDISDCLRRIAEQALRFDIILVDPWHEYGTSWRDLDAAFRLIRRDGTLIVHDCLPTNEAMAAPEFRPGEWCGVTYKAFVDFVTARDDLEYATVDTDYGCGVIRKLKPPGAFRSVLSSVLWSANSEQSLHRRELLRNWRTIGDDYSAAYRFFERNRVELLNLTSVRDFVAKDLDRDFRKAGL